MFYSLNHKIISIDEFLKEYEPHYYINSTSNLVKNRTSLFVEKYIEKILTDGLKPDELPLIMAWKIGAINHSASTNRIIFKDGCDQTLIFKTQYNQIYASPMVKYIQDNFAYLDYLSKEDPKQLFLKLMENKVDNFGSTYVITLLYFFTKGLLPIYDKYANIALLAYKDDINLGGLIDGYRQIPSSNSQSDWERAWNMYMDYCRLLLEIFGDDKYKNRAVDRSLWVYGHLFKVPS